jgi:hypothetical protein
MDKKKVGLKLELEYVLIPKTFLEKLTYYFYENTEYWKTLEDLKYILRDGTELTIPSGFTCDLCSIPPFLRGVISQHTTTVKAYILHDWLYKNDYKRKELGDKKAKIFADEEMLYQANILDYDKKRTNKLLYFGVKNFGNKVFKRTLEEEKLLKSENKI